MPPPRSVPPRSPVRRRLLGGTLGLAASALGGCSTASRPPEGSTLAPTLRLSFLGEGAIAHRTSIDGMPVGGLSGLDFDARTGAWLLISDDHRSDPPARYFAARITIAGARVDVRLEHAVALRTPDGRTFPKDRSDTESLRIAPDGSLLVTSEGRKRKHDAPWLRAFARDGRQLREFALPSTLQFGRRRGPRGNEVFEGLAIAPDGRSVFAALEGPLIQDAPPAGIDRGAPIRITRFDLASGRPTGQYVYPLAPLPHSAPFGITGRLAGNGVSEILALAHDRLLVLERGFAFGQGFTVRLFEASTAEASDVLDLPSLDRRAITEMRKTLVLDFDALARPIDNLEGMAFGPALPDGGRMLMFCADDNFSAFQNNQFLAFAVHRL